MNGTRSKEKLYWALVLNTFVLPGSGHVMLGYKLTGYLTSIIVVGLILLCIMAFGSSYVHAAFAVPPDIPGLSRVSETLSIAYRQNASLIKWSVIIILLAWAIGIADIVVRIRRRNDKTKTERL